MKHTYLILISLLYISTHTFAQRGNILPSNTSAGGADVASTDMWQAFTNPATAALHNEYVIEAAYENRYITKELSNKTLAALFPTKHFNITASFNHFGYSVYNEMLLGVGVSRSFGKWRLGVEVDGYMVYVSPTEKYAYTVTAQIGAQVDVSPKVTLGFSVFNPVFSSVKTAVPIHLPVRLSVGVNYHIHKTLDWLTQIDADVRSTVYWRTGFKYSPFDEFNVKVGAYGSDFIVPTIGLGLDLKTFKFNANCEIDPRMGVNLIGAVRIELENKKTE